MLVGAFPNAFTTITAMILRLIAEASGRDWIIDVVHDMERVEAAATNPRLDLKLIHMVRQRQAVLNSGLCRLYGQGIVSGYRRCGVQKIITVGRRHQQVLGRMGKVRNHLGDTCLEVDYDALCIGPGISLARIGGYLDLASTVAGLEAGEPSAPVPHLLRANGRLRRLDSVVVRRDTGCEDELSPVDHWLYDMGARDMARCRHVTADGLGRDGCGG